MFELSQTFKIVAGFIVAMGVVIGIMFGSVGGPEAVLICTKEPLYQLVPAVLMILMANLVLSRKYRKFKPMFDSMFIVFCFLALVYGATEYWWLGYLVMNTACDLTLDLLWAPILCIDGAVLGMIVSDFQIDFGKLRKSLSPDRRKLSVSIVMTLFAVFSFMLSSCTAYGLGEMPGYCRYIERPGLFWIFPVMLAWMSFPVTWVAVAFGMSLFLSTIIFFVYWYAISALVFLIYDEVKKNQ